MSIPESIPIMRYRITWTTTHIQSSALQKPRPNNAWKRLRRHPFHSHHPLMCVVIQLLFTESESLVLLHSVAMFEGRIPVWYLRGGGDGCGGLGRSRRSLMEGGCPFCSANGLKLPASLPYCLFLAPSRTKYTRKMAVWRDCTRAGFSHKRWCGSHHYTTRHSFVTTLQLFSIFTL